MTLSVEDRLEIMEVVARADWAATRRDADTYVGLFTEDAVLDGAQGEHRGSVELRRSVGPVWASEGPVSAHLTLNTVVRPVDSDSQRATATSVLLIVQGPLSLSVAGSWIIDQDLIQVDGIWRIERRSVSPLPDHGVEPT
jgi:hypothetical protein